MKKLLVLLLPLFICSGADIYVDVNANASGNGSKTAPYNSIQKAADKVSPGDTVIIMPGVYFETVRLKRFGTADAPVIFKADKVKKNRVIITSADKAVRTKAVKWQIHDKKTATYFVKTVNAHPPRVLYSGTDLFPYKTLAGLMSFEVRPGVPGPRHGFYFQKKSGKLFVRLRPDGKYGSADPNEHTMAIASSRENHDAEEKNPQSRACNFGLFGKPGQSLNVIIDGITFETPGKSAVYVSGNDVTVRNCLFLGCFAGGVSGRYIGENYSKRVEEASSNITVEQCEWHNFPIYHDVAELIRIVKTGEVKIANPKDQRFHYWVHKSPANGTLFYYETGIIRNIGKNWTLKKCYIHDVFDGIANMNWAENTVIEDNIFERCIDNAVETENHAKNCHIRGNRCIDIFQSFSYQPLGGLPWAGPIYIYKNLTYRTDENIFKTGSSSTFKIGIPAKQANNRMNKGRKEMSSYDWKNINIPGLHVFNNTFIEPGIRLIGDLDGPNQKIHNITFSNNIAVASALSYNLRRPGDGGVKTYNYTNNFFAFTAKAYPLFPAVKKQAVAIPEKVLPNWKDNNFVPAQFKAAAKVDGMPSQFKYAGALQSADEKIAETAGIVEDDVPEVKHDAPVAKAEVPAAEVKKAAVKAAGKTVVKAAKDKTVRLEWNIRNATDVAYELVIDREKLHKTAGFAIDASYGILAADANGKISACAVTALDTPEKNQLRLRFEVPSGTCELYLAPAGEQIAVECGEKVDNLLAGILDSAALWKGKDITVGKNSRGITLKAQKAVPVTAGAEARVPESARGKAAVLELDVKSLSALTYGTFIRVAQLDKNGRILSESVTDPRWISHMRPPQVTSRYRANGVIHPQAAKLRLEITLATKDSPYDNFGRLLKKPFAHPAEMEISRAAIRCAESLPFPRYNDKNFVSGVSGKNGDCALRLHESTAFTHVTTSHATWGEDRQIRKEEECFWPAGNGTIECFFCPDEKNSGKITLFDAANIRNSINGQYLKTRDSVFNLVWDADKNTGNIMIKDGKNKVHKGSFKLVLKPETWNHIACQWSDKDGISVYLNGKKIFAKKANVAPINLAKVKYPSTWMPHNVSIGASVKVARGHHLRSNTTPKFLGSIDLLRISSKVRYQNNFAPAKEFKRDRDTRALYNFDRSFSGVSGGGICRMLGTYDSPQNILDSSIECGSRKIQYFPAELPECNDPDKVICRINYPELPTRNDVLAARRVVRKTFDMTPGKKYTLDLDKQPYMDYIEITADRKTVRHPIVFNENEIDCRSFGDIAKTLNSGSASEIEKMYRVFNFMIYASDYFTSHQIDFPAHSDNAVRATSLALTMLNIYCGFNCGPLNDMLANIFACSAGAPATRTFGFGHSFQQVFYGGKNRLYDLSAQRFFPQESLEEAASLEDAEFSPNVLRALGTSTDPRRNTFGPDHYIRLTTKMKVLQEPGFQQRVAYDLRPGESMRLYFNNAGLFNDLQSFVFTNYLQLMKPVKDISEAGDSNPVVLDVNSLVRNSNRRFKVYKAYRVFPHYSNAFLKFDGKPSEDNPAFGKISSGSFCYKVELPYTVTAAVYKATADGKAVPMSISTDGGKTFHALPLDANGVADLEYEVRARHGYWIRVEKPINEVDNFSAVTAMMLNSRVQTGKLRKGANQLTFDSDTKFPVKVTLQYRVDDGKIEIAGNAYNGAMPGNERQLEVMEPETTKSLAVKGASENTKVKTFGNIKASYNGGKLTITAGKSSSPFFAGVILDDNGRKKELTVLVAKGARLVTVENGIIAGKGTKLLAPDKERLQKSIAFTSQGDSASMKFDALEGGKYNVWTLQRTANVSTRMPLMEMKESGGTVIEACRTINHTTDLYKAQFGRKQYSRFKWDCAFMLTRGNFFYNIPESYTLPEGCSSFKLKSIRNVKFDLAAVLIIPKPSRDFQIEMAKVLSGVNSEPWKIAADGTWK